MATFKVQVTEKVMQYSVFEVEAETEQEAIDKYCNELAGSISEINSWTEELSEDDEEDVIVID